MLGRRANEANPICRGSGNRKAYVQLLLASVGHAVAFDMVLQNVPEGGGMLDGGKGGEEERAWES